MSGMSRRQFLATTAGAAASTVGLSALASAAAYDAQPEYVDLVYDKTVLEMYRPLLVERHLEIQPDTLYGWVATSRERDTNIAVYFAWYTAGQRGIVGSESPVSDTHTPDREPIYVEYDPQTGEVVRVTYSGYHYIGATVRPGMGIELEGRQPKLHIVRPWHQYRTTTETGVNVELGNLHTVYDGWMENNWKAAPEAVVNPWRARERGHWWDNSAAGQFNRLFYSSLLDIQHTTGISIRGASESDL